MGLFTTYRIKKALAVILSRQDSSSPETTRAIARLKEMQPAAIPKLIEALEQARDQEKLIPVLVALVDNETLPLFVSALSDAPSPRVVEGVVEVLSRSTKYNPTRLLGFLSHPNIASEHLERIILNHKRELRADALLRLFNTMGREHHPAILRLIDQVATEEIIPELIYRLGSEETDIRLHIVRTLCRFNTQAVHNTLVRLLTDQDKQMRFMAMKGLMAMNRPFNMQPVCQLLTDPDATIRGGATDMLLDVLQNEAEQVRQGALEGLNLAGDATVLKQLLSSLRNKDWWVTVRVADALGSGGGRKILEAIVTLLKDQDKFIRQCAFEVLQAIKEERVFNTFVDLLKDKEIRKITVEALAGTGDKRAIPVFLRMLERGSETSIIAIRGLVAIGDPQTIHPLLLQLQSKEKAVRQETLRALAVLTNAVYAADVLQAIMAVGERTDGDEKELANRIATTLIKKWGAKAQLYPATTGGAMPPPLSLEEVTADIAPPAAGGASPGRGVSGRITLANEHGTSEIVDVDAIEAGVVLADRYRVIRRVGQGSFSVVFLVEDMMVHEEMILKILNLQMAIDDEMLKRFIHELRYARRITHENVIRIYDFVSLGERAYAISMEYFPGHSLAEELQGEMPLNRNRGLKIIWDICRGMSAAHQVEVVHRDLKPPNVLINDRNIAKIVDFGVAAVTSNMATRLTRVGTLLGTPTYMAPEQVRSRAIDARTDIYSLGVIMYEVFTGRPPYVGDDMSVLFQHVEGKPQPPTQINKELPPALEAIILKAMAVDPEQRFQNMDELRKSLVDFSRQRG